MEALKWLIMLFALGVASCKGASLTPEETPNKKSPTGESVEATAMIGEETDGDLFETNEPQDTAVTPILVTGTYLTCVDVAVSKSYDYEERGRIVGCRLIDRNTGRQVAMERVAHHWQWRVQVPLGVTVEQTINSEERALYPLVLVLKGASNDGRDILDTLVEVTLDLILAVDDPLAQVLSVVLNEVLQAIPPDQLEEQITFPPPVNAEENSTQDTNETQSLQEEENSEDTVAEETDTVSETVTGPNPNVTAEEEGESEVTVTQTEAVGAELPTTVPVTFSIVSRPGGARITMAPAPPAGVEVSEENFRVTGEIVAQSPAIKGQDLLFSWTYPVEVTFRLDGKVTCRAQGFVGSSAQEVTATCQ